MMNRDISLHDLTMLYLKNKGTENLEPLELLGFYRKVYAQMEEVLENEDSKFREEAFNKLYP